MWQCVRSLYNNHILVHPDLYISCDDIIAINDLIYDITGISDDYDVYVQDSNKKQNIYPAGAFVQMLQSNDFKCIRNVHQENVEKNKMVCKLY